MASQKKKTGRKSSKSSANSKVDLQTDAPFFGMVLGWFVVAIGVLTLVGCMSFVCSGENNWLGPYLGGLLPRKATFLFGRVGVVFFSFSAVLWGLFIAVSSLREKLLRFAIGCTLLTLDLCFLLALKIYKSAKPSFEDISMSGGVVGRFFSQYVFVPFFGLESCLAPLILLLTVLVLILVLSFGLRPRHFHFIAEGMRWFVGLFKRNREKASTSTEPESETFDDPALKRRGVTMMDDETLLGTVDDYKILRKNKIKPFSGRNNWLENDSAEFTQAKIPEMDFDEATRPVADNGEEAETSPMEPAEYDPKQGDPEIARLEEELRLNGGRMNALEIMQIKDRIAALRRARDLINWEKEHHGRLVVKGAVRGDTPVSGSMPSVSGSMRTVASDIPECESEEPTIAKESMEKQEPDYENDPTVNGAEGLLGGDGARKDEFVPEDDDEFVPEVVSADDALKDPTLVRSSGSTLGHGTSIPQPDPTVYDKYEVPSIAEILDEHEPQAADYTEDELNAIGRMLEEKLENFKVKGKVVGCETGPMITRFEVEPGPGVKVSQFSALHEDLALALKVTSIRILTPIPGKGAVGIEIPNRKFQTVYGRDVFESDKFAPNPEKIVVALGKDITGEAFTMDIAKAPHLLIAGQTGSGKSVCINALMASILFSKTPDELRLILVDPKAVELKMYENIPHLLAPVITKPEIAIQALEWLCYEMDRRTEVLALAKVRNIGGFNMKFDAGELPCEVPEEDRSHRMAFIVVIIDELADLMMVAGKEIEKSIARLAAKARAVGIHLVLATQRPSVKVVTGIIKANLPTRISFKVASQVDARTVMDHAGAEKLLGRGDMLYKAVNDPDPVRVHGAFLSDEEAEKLADACSNQNVNYPQLETFEITGIDDEEDGGNAAMNEKLDKLLFDVAEWAISMNGLSTSAVQRHFSVGYSRAGKIVDQLYGLGVCGPAKGNSKPRAMLIGIDELMNLQRSGKLG